MTGPTPEMQRERERATSCLPVTKEAVTRALTRIAENPDRALVEEGTVMQVTNPDLNMILMSMIQSFPVQTGTFSEGALWTYRILREQAELRGGTIPQLSKATCDNFLYDNLERLKTVREKGQSMRLDNLVRLQIEQLSAEEPELAAGLKELTKYRAGQTDFYQGVVPVYFAIKRDAESKKLSKELGL